jgi:hypothetical protein
MKTTTLFVKPMSLLALTTKSEEPVPSHWAFLQAWSQSLFPTGNAESRCCSDKPGRAKSCPSPKYANILTPHTKHALIWKKGSLRIRIVE